MRRLRAPRGARCDGPPGGAFSGPNSRMRRGPTKTCRCCGSIEGRFFLQRLGAVERSPRNGGGLAAFLHRLSFQRRSGQGATFELPADYPATNCPPPPPPANRYDRKFPRYPLKLKAGPRAAMSSFANATKRTTRAAPYVVAKPAAGLRWIAQGESIALMFL